MNDDDLVAGYLGRLVQAARALPPDRRAELVDEIADHIEQARATGEASGPGLQDLLHRLGEPQVIAEAASDSASDFTVHLVPPGSAGAPASAARGPRLQRRLDIAAVLLVLGSVLLSPLSFVLALLGWAVGVVMLLLSPRWPKRAKVLGVVTGTLVLILYGGLLATLAKAWRPSWMPPGGALGWQTGGGSFVSTVVVTGVVVAVTLIAVRLMRYPLAQAAGTRSAKPESLGPAGQAPAARPEPAAPARAG